MRRSVVTAPGVAHLDEQVSPPGPEVGQTLLGIEAVGICGSDLHLYRADLGESHAGLLPVTLGHEFSAVVEQADPSGRGPAAGQRVVCWPDIACGQCRPCRQRRPNVCQHLKILGVHTDGALQDCLTVATDSLVPVPALSWRQAALVEPTSIGVHALRRGGVAMPGEAADRSTGDRSRVVVLGAGPIGYTTAVAARDAGAEVMLVETSAARRERIAAHGFTALHPEAAAAATSRWAGTEGPHLVVDTTGVPEVLDMAVTLVGHGGTVVVVGMTGDAASFHPGMLPIREIDVLGASCATYEEFAQAASVIVRNPEVIDDVVTHVLPLERFDEGLSLMEDRNSGALKVLIAVSVG